MAINFIKIGDNIKDYINLPSDLSTINIQNCIKQFPKIDTSKVTNMKDMCNGCSSLITIPVLDTSKVTNMKDMLAGCSSLSNDSLNNALQMCNNANVPQISFYDTVNKYEVTAYLPKGYGTDYNYFLIVRHLNYTNRYFLIVSKDEFYVSLLNDVTPHFSPSNSAILYYISLKGFYNPDNPDEVDFSTKELSDFNSSKVGFNSGLITNINQFVCSNFNIYDNSNKANLKFTSNSEYLKTLKYIGLSEEQATTCTTLSNWAACETAGWTTGY